MQASLDTPIQNEISANLETSLTSNLANKNSDEYSRTIDISAVLGLVNNSGRWAINYNASKDTLREREYEAQDGSIRWSNTLSKYKNLSIGASASTILPISEKSRTDNFLYTRFSTGPSFSLKGNGVIGLDLLQLSYSPIVAKSFHQYTTSRTGASNNEYSFIQQSSLLMQMNSHLSLSLFGSYTRHWTYERNTKDAFLFDQSLTWSINSNFSLTLGHNNQGNALAANGVDSGVDIYDINSSTIYTTLGIGLP